MPNKMPTEIREILLNDATFHGVTIDNLTLVNFFYGNNGSGKSTIGRAINGGSAIKSKITYDRDKTAANYRTLVYNQDYIAKLINNAGDIPGVFTFHTAEDERIETQISEIMPMRMEYANKVNATRDLLADYEKKAAGRVSSYREIFWQTTDKVRQRFSSFVSGLLRGKDAFMDTILKTPPEESDLDELEQLCASAFDSNAKTYELINKMTIPGSIKDVESSELLKQKIASRSETPFAEYMRAIQATSWVQEGHKHFHKNDGKCPYCQQELPADFEEQLAACFDNQYQEDVATLQRMAESYYSYARKVSDFFSYVFESRNPAFLAESLVSYQSAIVNTIEINLTMIQQKIKDPATIVELKEYDSLVDSLNHEIDRYNEQTKKNNEIIANRRQGRKECERKIWSHLSYMVRDSVEQFKNESIQHESEIKSIKEEGNEAYKNGKALQEQIDALRSQTGNTIDAMKSINTILDDSGFQGFRLEENPAVKNHYHIVRPGQDADSPATNLSEGERNFIAFLYFYHEVKGSNTKTNEIPEKIVVIDDPVSSMDSQVLFVVCALVRELIEICLNNSRALTEITRDDYIKQIFLLTHNTYYHRQLSHDYVANYEAVSFYRIYKEDNNSDVEVCTQWHPLRPSELMNRNPVEDAYAALWREYQEVKTCTALMSVIRRILEYYFLQISCYNGLDLRKKILEDNRHKFVKPDGSFNEKSHRLARTMLAYIYADSIGFNDGMDYVHEGFDPDKMRDIFKLVFDIMEQPQHYKMMIENTSVR